VITRRDEESTRKLGVFQAAYALLDGGPLPVMEHEKLADVIDWSEKYLPRPAQSRTEEHCLVPVGLALVHPENVGTRHDPGTGTAFTSSC
jgi:hypothetical protein